MAHITVELRPSPDAAPVARLEPAGADIGALLPEFDDESFPLLRLVDPYGDTYFSRYQMAGILPEIGRLQERRAIEVLGQLADLAEECRRTPHSFLVFVGD